jgi:hypothetical protein
MKKIMSVATVALALAGVLTLAGCMPGADQAARNDHGTNVPTSQPAPPPAANTDTGSVDGDMGDIDKTLSGVDADLSAAADSSHDAD